MFPGTLGDDVPQLLEQAFLEGSPTENRTLEYKGALDLEQRDHRALIAEAVCALANTDGGDLVIGVEAPEGIPTGFAPMMINESLDSWQARVEHTLRDGLDPPLPPQAYRLATFPVTGGYVAVVRVGRSYRAPHRAAIRGHREFYARSMTGKRPMDATELREAFLRSERDWDRLQRFVNERLEHLVVGRNHRPPVNLVLQPKIVLHLIPIGWIARTEHIDVAAARHDLRILDIGDFPVDRAYPNPEGHLALNTTREDGQTGARAYRQVFREGAIEIAHVCTVHDTSAGSAVHLPAAENLTNRLLHQHLNALRDLGVMPPITAVASVLDAGAHVGMYPEGPNGALGYETGNRLHQAIFTLPAISLESFEVDSNAEMIPAYNVLWQGFGVFRDGDAG